MLSTVDFARKYLIVEGKCGRHCDRPVRFATLVERGDELTGAYCDPDNYASRVVYFSLAPNLEWFRSFLKVQVGDRLNDKDLRFATRHGWELGHDAEREAKTIIEKGGVKGIVEYYWTFYPKSDEDKSKGTFLCAKENGGCGQRLFVSEYDRGQKLCELCRV